MQKHKWPSSRSSISSLSHNSLNKRSWSRKIWKSFCQMRRSFMRKKATKKVNCASFAKKKYLKLNLFCSAAREIAESTTTKNVCINTWQSSTSSKLKEKMTHFKEVRSMSINSSVRHAFLALPDAPIVLCSQWAVRSCRMIKNSSNVVWRAVI